MANPYHDEAGRFATGGGGGGELNADEKHAMGIYTGAGNQEMNAILRGTETKPAAVNAYQPMINQLDSAIIKQPGLTEDTVLYRGIPADVNNFAYMAKGDTFTEPGFTSTSFEDYSASRFSDITEAPSASGTAMQGAMMEIHAPPGTQGLDVEQHGGSSEAEYILPRNSTFELQSYKVRAEPGGTTMRLAVVNLKQ